MEREVRVESVQERQTRSGNTRYVLRDGDGEEYTTFRPAIGQAAAALEGKRARITFHEEERNGFRNVYLDGAEAVAGDEGGPKEGEAAEADEVAWNTAVEAAPWLVGSGEPDEAVAPEELYERLEPFKRLVAEDIRQGGEHDDEDAPKGS
jgi:hypothetical protein